MTLLISLPPFNEVGGRSPPPTEKPLYRVIQTEQTTGSVASMAFAEAN
jgi:hypothetical protein